MAMNPALQALLRQSAEKSRHAPVERCDDDAQAAGRSLLDCVMRLIEINEAELERSKDVITIAQLLVEGQSILSKGEIAKIRELLKMLHLSLGNISAASKEIGNFVEDLEPVEGDDLKAA